MRTTASARPDDRPARLCRAALQLFQRADCAATPAAAASGVLVRIVEHDRIDWAGEQGLHFVTLGPMQTAKENIDAFKAAFAKRGRAAQPKAEFPGGAAIGVQRHIFVADTDEEANWPPSRP